MLEQKTQKEKIELKVKCFMTKNQYESLLKYLNSFAEFKDKNNMVIYEFSNPAVLKVQKDNYSSVVYARKNNLKAVFQKEEFDDLVDIFETLGFDISIKWFKTGHNFFWNEIEVNVEMIKGYGFIVEMTKSAFPEEKEILLNYLRENLKQLGLEETPSEVFNERLKYYQENWKDLV